MSLPETILEAGSGRFRRPSWRHLAGLPRTFATGIAALLVLPIHAIEHVRRFSS